LQPILQFPRLAASLFLLGLALESSALTIGRPQGAVWIGKPMDVAIPLSLDSAEAGGSLCLEATVLQGDTPIPDRRVTVSLEPGAGPGNPNMRVRSTVPMEEPVVTVTVRAGCDMKSTRSYVLLADVPTDVALPGVMASGARSFASDAAPPAARPVPRPVARNANGGSASADGTRVRTAQRSTPPRDEATSPDAEPPAPRRAPAVAAPVAPRRAAAAKSPAAPQVAPATPTPPVPAPRQEPSTGGARLRVEPLEPQLTKEAGLKTTTELTLPAVEDPGRRAAAAALWSAMNPQPQEAQREAQRAKDMDATLAALREQTAQNQRALLELRSELAQARESQFRNPLVYTLIVLLLLALIGMLLLWRLARRPVAPAWWGEAPPPKGEGARRRLPQRGLLDDEMDLDAEPDTPPPRRSASTGRTFVPTPFAPLEPDVPDDSGFDEPLAPPVRTFDNAPVRPVNTEELFDVQQQSDFFLSLGQHDQAIAVLREHIAANPGTSALTYLDLLRIFHSLDRKEDYARLAEEFEHAFNADVPAFEHFTEAGKGLEHYRSALGRIESQWPAPGTLALIEELIFRKPGVHEEGAFDLAAYQELLLLYAVAKEVIDPDSAPPASVTPHSFADTSSHEEMPTATAPLELDTQPPAMHDGPVLPPSIYGAIDDGLHHDTVMVPDAPVPIPPLGEAPPRAKSGVDLDLAEFDKTAYETMPSPIETPKPPPAPSTDPHVIDFDLFDPNTEAEIAPRPIIKR
jgi:tetratricopeptide (TPR) repeat protein